MLLGYYSPRFLCKLLWCFDFTDFDENTPRQKEADRKRSLDIERWLKNKFREGFQNLKIAFEEMDAEKSGVVSLHFRCLRFTASYLKAILYTDHYHQRLKERLKISI